MAAEDTLSLENDFLLDVNRDEVVKRIDIVSSRLLENLQAREVITGEQIDEIKQIPSKLQRCIKVLEIVRSKTNKDFDQFCSALQETGHGHLVSNFLNKAAVHRRVKQLQQHLATYYRDTYMDDMFAYHEEGHRVPMDDVYQPVEWVLQEKSAAGCTMRPLDGYLDLFAQTESCGRYIITAEAAGGKTTMVRKICRDWAQQHLGEVTGKKAIMRKFDIAIPFVLKRVREGATLVEAVKRQIDIPERYMKTVAFCLRVGAVWLYVVEGLDEHGLSKSEEVTSLLNGSLYPSSWCVILTRPEGTSYLKHWPRVRYQTVDHRGFTDETVRTYIKRFFRSGEGETTSDQLLEVLFPEFPPEADSWSKIVVDPLVDIAQLSCNPGQLSLTCIILSEMRTLPTVKEVAIEEIIRMMLRRWEKRFKIMAKFGTHIRHDIIRRNDKYVLKIAALAAKTEDGRMKRAFSYDEVSFLEEDNLMGLAMVYKSYPAAHLADCEYSFVHKSIQQYFAAYYMAFCVEDKTAALRAAFDELMQLCDESYHHDDTSADRVAHITHNFRWLVTCGLVSLKELSPVLTECLQQPHHWEAGSHVLFLLQGALKRVSNIPQKGLPEAAVVEHDDERFTFQMPIYTIHQVGEHSMAPPPNASSAPYMDTACHVLKWYTHLQVLRLIDYPPEKEDEPRINAFRKCGRKTELVYLHQNPLALTGPSVEHVELRTAGRILQLDLGRTIRSVEICQSKLAGKGAWIGSMLQVLNGAEVSIQACDLQQKDIQDMNTCLANLRKQSRHQRSLQAERLYFNKNNLAGAGEDIVRLLKHMPKLSTIDLENSNLTEKDKEVIQAYIMVQNEKAELNFGEPDEHSSSHGSDTSSNRDRDCAASTVDTPKAAGASSEEPAEDGKRWKRWKCTIC